MAIEQLKVHEIVQQAICKQLDVPEFQRQFVWDPEQVKKLAESLYRDYPVGSFLLWHSSQYGQPKTAKGTEPSLWIVDGQQRTTALCLLLGKKPYWWDDTDDWNKALDRYDVMVRIPVESNTGYLEFGLPNPIRRHDPHWISLRQILAVDKAEDLTGLALDIAKRVASSDEQQMLVFGPVHANLIQLWQARERDIPIIKISHEVEDVAEIFTRINQEGTRVREADVILALAAVHNPGWVREDYLPYANGLEDQGWDLGASVFVRTMSGIGCGRARLIEVPNNFWDAGNLQAHWKATRETITDVVKRLAEFGITSADLLPSTNSLIPLFTLHSRWRGSAGYAFQKALHWFLLANRDGRYGGSPITSLNEDVRAISEAATFQEALDSLHKRLQVSPRVDEGEFLDRYDRSGNRFLRLMLYLAIFRRGAKDWVDGTRIGYDNTGALAVSGFQPQWHHIYPRHVLRKAGHSDDDINTLANITVLNERTNVNRLAGKEPARYIQQFGISQEMLLGHLVPHQFAQANNDKAQLADQWDVRRYSEFTIERAVLLSKAANEFLSSLRNS